MSFLRFGMRRGVLIACWLVIVGLAVWLRCDDFADRPIHFDEATGARITADRLEPDAEYSFNPVHNHGPTLSVLGAIASRAAGEATWEAMTVGTLRLIPLLAGCGLVVLPFLLRDRIGDVPALIAAAFLASSPLLVYYSRMYIHEILLALFGLAAAICLLRRKTLWLAGCFLGLMFATKETFAISVIAWCVAGVGVACHFRASWKIESLREMMGEWWKPVAVMVGCAAMVSIAFYTNGFTHWMGIVDAVKTYFVYETVGGHDKPFWYYAGMMLVPRKDAVWWGETVVVVFAGWAYFRSFFGGMSDGRKALIWFLAYSAVAHGLIYSLIAYKTPWLMCLPWAHGCLLAGVALVGCERWKTWQRGVLVLGLIAALGLQLRQTRYAMGRFETDQRNRYAYVPTSRDLEGVPKWMVGLADGHPDSIEPIAVVGTFYWPLPWYLRGFDSVGYWPDAEVEGLEQNGIVFALPDTVNDVSPRLAKSHQGFPRSLRTNEVVTMYVRNDLWDRWIEEDE